MKKNVAMVSIYKSETYVGKWFWCCDVNEYSITSPYFSLRSSAISNARQFFKKLGYGVEIYK